MNKRESNLVGRRDVMWNIDSTLQFFSCFCLRNKIHELCFPLIDYASHHLFCDRYSSE